CGRRCASAEPCISSSAVSWSLSTSPNAVLTRAKRRRRWSPVRRAVAIAAIVVAAAIAGRVLLVDGLLRCVTIDGPSMAPVLCGISCEVICEDCRFRFLCDAAYLPKDRLAVCPNCGFGRNDLDRAHWLAPDWVLIDRWPVMWRNLQRGEIVAAMPVGSREL